MSRTAAKRRPNRSGGRRRQGGFNPIWLIVGVGVAAIVGGLAISLSRQLTVIEGVQSYGAIPAGVHVSGVATYDQSPPVGGPHSPSWQTCGIYDQPITDEAAVHSMEHGAVWIAYRPDLPAAEVEQLRGLVRGRGYTLLSPYEGLDAPVAASAWGFQLKVDSAGDERIGQFINKYRQGPQTPEPGASCVGGIGTPLER